MKWHPWYKHDAEAWLADLRLRQCGLEGKGLLEDLMCFAHKGTPRGYCTEGGFPLSVADLSEHTGVDSETISRVLAKLREKRRIDCDDKGTIFIPRMVAETMQLETASANGKKAHTDLTNDPDGCINKGHGVEESKTESKIRKREAGQVLSYLNEKLNSNYRLSKHTLGRIVWLLEEGYVQKDFESVITKQIANWTGTDMAQHLTPKTLFGDKFDRYLNAPMRPVKAEDVPTETYKAPWKDGGE